MFRLGVFSNPAMNKAFLAGVALQGLVLLAPPLQGAFSVVPMALSQWGDRPGAGPDAPGGVRLRKLSVTTPGEKSRSRCKRRRRRIGNIGHPQPWRLGVLVWGGWRSIY